MMKLKYMIWLAWGALFASACSEEEIMDYALDGKVYFYERQAQGGGEIKIENATYSFAVKEESLVLDSLKVRTRLMGSVTDYDRTFRVETVTEGTTAVAGTHYRLLDGVMKAGEYEAYLPVEIYRTADTKEKEVTLVIRLVDAEELTPGHPEDITFTLTWGNKLVQPATWPIYYWGAYYDTKYEFAIRELGISEYPTYGRYDTAIIEGYYTVAQLIRFASQLNNAYREYRQENGPIYNIAGDPASGEINYGAN